MHVHLQAVDVQQVQLSFVRLLQDVTLLNVRQMLLQIPPDLFEASEKDKHE